MALKAPYPAELVVRLVIKKAPSEGIDLSNYAVYNLRHVDYEISSVDRWIIPSKYSDKNYLDVLISETDDGVTQLAFSEI